MGRVCVYLRGLLAEDLDFERAVEGGVVRLDVKARDVQQARVREPAGAERHERGGLDERNDSSSPSRAANPSRRGTST